MVAELGRIVWEPHTHTRRDCALSQETDRSEFQKRICFQGGWLVGSRLWPEKLALIRSSSRGQSKSAVVCFDCVRLSGIVHNCPGLCRNLVAQE